LKSSFLDDLSVIFKIIKIYDTHVS